MGRGGAGRDRAGQGGAVRGLDETLVACSNNRKRCDADVPANNWAENVMCVNLSGFFETTSPSCGTTTSCGVWLESIRSFRETFRETLCYFGTFWEVTKAKIVMFVMHEFNTLCCLKKKRQWWQKFGFHQVKKCCGCLVRQQVVFVSGGTNQRRTLWFGSIWILITCFCLAGNQECRVKKIKSTGSNFSCCERFQKRANW